MNANNACEAIITNPQLSGTIAGIVRSFWRRNRDLMLDVGYDEEDLSQDLMLKLLEEPVQPEDRYYVQLSVNRLIDIVRRCRKISHGEDELPEDDVLGEDEYGVAV